MVNTFESVPRRLFLIRPYLRILSGRARFAVDSYTCWTVAQRSAISDQCAPRGAQRASSVRRWEEIGARRESILARLVRNQAPVIRRHARRYRLPLHPEKAVGELRNGPPAYTMEP